MAGFISYEIENQGQLKQQTQEVLNRTAVALGFDTARKSLDITIRFAKGASHQSWSAGSVTSSQQLALWLTGGFRAGKGHVRVPPRPALDNYVHFHSAEIKNRCVQAFQASGTIRDKAYKAGVEIMEDLKRQVYRGSLYLIPNSGSYRKRKMRHGYGDVPFVATKALMKDLEVVIE